MDKRNAIKAVKVALAIITFPLNCPIDYFRNVDSGHFDDDKKKRCDCYWNRN